MNKLKAGDTYNWNGIELEIVKHNGIGGRCIDCYFTGMCTSKGFSCHETIPSRHVFKEKKTKEIVIDGVTYVETMHDPDKTISVNCISNCDLHHRLCDKKGFTCEYGIKGNNKIWKEKKEMKEGHKQSIKYQPTGKKQLTIKNIINDGACEAALDKVLRKFGHLGYTHELAWSVKMEEFVNSINGGIQFLQDKGYIEPVKSKIVYDNLKVYTIEGLGGHVYKLHCTDTSAMFCDINQSNGGVAGAYSTGQECIDKHIQVGYKVHVHDNLVDALKYHGVI